MANQSADITVSQAPVLLEELLSQMASGRLRLPEFQRRFVWNSRMVLDLFDSIDRGYPIGSLVIWDTPTEMQSLDEIAGIWIPAAPATGTTSYVIDGNQRLTALFGALYGQLRKQQESEGLAREPLAWDVYRVLGDPLSRHGRFRHWTGTESPPVTHLPMRSVLRTIDFLGYVRRLAIAFADDETTLSALTDEAEQVAYRFKSYQIAVVHLKGSELTPVVEIFSRLNTRGQQLTADELAAARTYQSEVLPEQADEADSDAE